MKNVTILGSTGSIGTQTLEVCREQGFKIVALAANSNVAILEEQIREFKPSFAVLGCEKFAADLKARVADLPIKILFGEGAICEVAANPKNDIVLNAIVGIAGLKPTLAALEQGIDVALANKETLVAAGEIVLKLARSKGAKLIPVDSEHSAIFQCLQAGNKSEIQSILLTASGGPFAGFTTKQLEDVTIADALNHPNWSMGKKISIDSATLMNKGLELIEAVHFFDISEEKIKTILHRQSIVHSAVEFTDGSIISQMGGADMKIPIRYAFGYPTRLKAKKTNFDLTTLTGLTFENIDNTTFRSIDLARSAIRQGGLFPCIYNGANEAAVELFLQGKIKFLQIQNLVQVALENAPKNEGFSLENVFEADLWSRNYVKEQLNA